MIVVAATKNKGKIREMQTILGELDIDVKSQSEMGINVDVEENGTTFEENALIKARAVAALTDNAVIADDSGLCVECLDGRPGIYSARYAGEDASDSDRIEKLLSEMKSSQNRTAKFVCAVAMIYPDGRELTALGEVYGSITDKPIGKNGFGYDPVFVPDELGKTFAEASDEEKNNISHRKRALMKLKEKASHNE